MLCGSLPPLLLESPEPQAARNMPATRGTATAAARRWRCRRRGEVMVSLSVTRLVGSGGPRATGRRCDVVSVTDLRSIANISLLMLDIDVMDPAYQPLTSAFAPPTG